MREWLTVIVALLILAVVLDGIRRMRNARRSALRMSPTMHRDTDKEAPQTYGSELPSGGARVVKVRKADDARQRYRQIRQSSEEGKRRLGRANRIPEQVALNLDEQVPTLMEVEEAQEKSAASQGSSRKPEAKRDDKAAEPAGQQDDLLEIVLDFDDDRIEPQLSDDDLNDTSLQSLPSGDSQPEPGDPKGADEEDTIREPDDVLVINVMAPKGHFFPGDQLLKTVLERGMRFGSMDIFHHHADAKGEGGVLYSMANIVVPGTFDLAAMKEFRTPGVSLFLALPVEADSSEAFESMLATARAIAGELRGELKDEDRSVLTAQTIEHYRSRIKEFERKKLSRAPA